MIWIDYAREIYEKCIETLGEEFIDQNVYISFAKFETRQKEIDRARAIYKYALDKLSSAHSGGVENLRNVYTQFEKQYGGKDGIEDVIIAKRRIKYEEVIFIIFFEIYIFKSISTLNILKHQNFTLGTCCEF